MGQQVGQATMRLLQCGPDSDIGQRQSQRQSVNEQSQRLLATVLQPTQQHGAEDHIITTGQRTDNLAPGQMEQTGGTDALMLRLPTNAPGQCVRQRQDSFTHIDQFGQAAGQRGGFHIGQLLMEKRVIVSGGGSGPHLCDMMTERRRGGQLLQFTALVRVYFVKQNIQRGVIQTQVMMLQAQQPAVIGFIVCHQQVEQRCLTQIQTPRFHAEQLIGSVARCRIQVHRRCRQFGTP